MAEKNSILELSSEISEKAKKKFCKDYNIPINIFIEPYFSQRLLLLDKNYNCLNDYKTLVELIRNKGSEDVVFQEINDVRNHMIDFLKVHPATISLTKCDMNQFNASLREKVSVRNIYSHQNCDIPLISIDLKHGNFTALKWYAANFQSGFEKDFDSYSDFVSKFTNNEYIKNSKSIRQAVFGNCCPRRFEAIERFLMIKIIEKLNAEFQKECIDFLSYVFFFTNDEILIIPDKADNINKWFAITSNVLKNFEKEEGVQTKIQSFVLTKGKTAKGYFKNISKEITFAKDEVVKENFVELKTFSKKEIPFAIRELNNEEPEDSDYFFIDEEKNLCKIINQREIIMKEVEIFTDGACFNNPGPGGWAAIIRENGIDKELVGGTPYTTNNRMELTAVVSSLATLNESCKVTLTTDSKYVCDPVDKGWVYSWQKNNWQRANKKPALNVDLWEQLLVLLEKHKVTFNWVKGHAGHPENERCDRLAESECRKYIKG